MHVRRVDFASLLEIASAFLRLGCLSFGGPIAHLAYFREEFVERRAWIDDERYADLVALCQFLPGPASSQVVFALGTQRGGFWGACVASLCFTLPSALLMLGFAVGLAHVDDLSHLGAFAGLRLAAVAVVAQAVWDMGRKLCPDRERISLGLLAAALLLVWPGSLAQVVVLALGGAVGAWFFRDDEQRASPVRVERSSEGHRVAAFALVTFALLLAVLPPLARAADSRAVELFDAFYRSGALVFGGGHVMLPLLRAELVPRGWISDAQFLAGYGAAQALPGPITTFAAFLGATVDTSSTRVATGVWCLFSMFLPAWLVVGGALPFWERLSKERLVRAALRGIGASVVGLLLAALYTPLVTESVERPVDVAVVLVSFGSLAMWRVPAWVVVLLSAAFGQWLRGA